jgi:D-alanine-D-alanine ligase
MKKALQLLGSPTSQFYFDLSLLYGRHVICPQGFELIYAIAFPDETWCITQDIESQEQRCSLVETIPFMQQVDLAVPHMFCNKGLTDVRVLVENVLGIPLVGSSGYITALAQNKHLTKQVAHAAGINVPDGELRSCLPRHDRQIRESVKNLDQIKFPVIIKPNKADNSDGLSLVHSKSVFTLALEKAFQHDDEVLVEEYIEGREIRGAVLELNGEFAVLPFIEYKVHKERPIRYAEDKLKFDKNGKLKDQSDKVYVPAQCPAELDETLKNRLAEEMITMHKALGCRDFSMFDFRVSENNITYLLEAGLFWSFSARSMISNMLEHTGYDLEGVTRTIWNQAIDRQP